MQHLVAWFLLPQYPHKQSSNLDVPFWADKKCRFSLEKSDFPLIYLLFLPQLDEANRPDLPVSYLLS